jgi:hypothetical protein
VWSVCVGVIDRTALAVRCRFGSKITFDVCLRREDRSSAFQSTQTDRTLSSPYRAPSKLTAEAPGTRLRAARHSHVQAEMNDDDADRFARLQRLLGKLEQVSKQASDLGRMAKELHQEARDSMRLATGAAGPNLLRKRRANGQPRKQKQPAKRSRSKS